MYQDYSNRSSDLALIELAGDLSVSDSISPICLPPDEGFADHGSGRVAGWGLLKTERRSCYTDQYGPAPFSQCRF